MSDDIERLAEQFGPDFLRDAYHLSLAAIAARYDAQVLRDALSRSERLEDERRALREAQESDPLPFEVRWDGQNVPSWHPTLRDAATEAVEAAAELTAYDWEVPDCLPTVALVLGSAVEITTTEDLPEGFDHDYMVIGYRFAPDLDAVRALIDQVWGPGVAAQLGEPVDLDVRVSW